MWSPKVQPKFPRLENTKHLLSSSFENNDKTLFDNILENKVSTNTWSALNYGANFFPTKGNTNGGCISENQYDELNYTKQNAIYDLAMTIIPCLSEQQFFEITDLLITEEIECRDVSAFRGEYSLAKVFLTEQIASAWLTRENKQQLPDVIQYYLQRLVNSKIYGYFKNNFGNFIENFVFKILNANSELTHHLLKLNFKLLSEQALIGLRDDIKKKCSNNTNGFHINHVRQNIVESITLLDQTIGQLAATINPPKNLTNTVHNQEIIVNERKEASLVKKSLTYLNEIISKKYNHETIIKRFSMLLTLVKSDYENHANGNDRVFEYEDIRQLCEKSRVYIKNFLDDFNQKHPISNSEEVKKLNLKNKEVISDTNLFRYLGELELSMQNSSEDKDILPCVIKTYNNFAGLVAKNVDVGILSTAFNKICLIFQNWCKDKSSPRYQIGREYINKFAEKFQQFFNNLEQQCNVVSQISLEKKQ